MQLNRNTLRSVVREMTVILSLFVVLGVFWGLKLTGITMAGEAFCGKDEHSHDERCTIGELLCELEETEGHIHSESCIRRILSCEQETEPIHEHDESCRQKDLICEIPEQESHTHEDACRGRDLICEKTEQAGHTHDTGCHDQELICTQEERDAHIHGEGCYESSLICTVADDPDHVHGTECYEQICICSKAETEGHRHGDACYQLSDAVICGLEECEGHTHEETCYQVSEEFTCGLEECEGHTHEDSCYLVHEDLFSCGMDEEVHPHTHTEDCYSMGIGFGCGMTEAEGHVHDESCLTEETELDCGLEYVEGHAHTDECYETLEECPLEEHIHEADCYSDNTADLETEWDWEKSLIDVKEEVTSAKTLVAVARSQLGYTESTRNFEVDLHDVRRGITRYGQWYGNPYGDWSAMFVSFCLHYAKVDEVPANAGPESMRLEWEKAGLYQAADVGIPQVGHLIFFRRDPNEKLLMEAEGENPEETAPIYDKDAAQVVGIITEVTAETLTVIQGDLEDQVAERTVAVSDPLILGFGLIPERSVYALRAAPAGELKYVARPINYQSSILTNDRQFVLYVQQNGANYAIDGNGNAIPVTIENDGIYANVESSNSLLWTFTRSGNRYVIQNVGSGRYLHPYYNSATDYGLLNNTNWDTPVTASGTGAKFIHSASARLNAAGTAFEITRNQNEASVFRFGVVETVTVWLDGTNGGISALGGAQNQSSQVSAGSDMVLPEQWLSPTKYSYRLRGWYDVTHDRYYAPGETVTITENTVFYADWMASTYNVGQYNAQVANTVSTNSFITTRLFDYNYLFNVLSADSSGSISTGSHSETWDIVRNETVDYEDRESLNFIFLDYGNGGTLDYPNNRQSGVNEYPGAGIVTGGIYNSAIGNALFSTNDNVPGKVYLGTADHLFQIMDDPNDPYYGYYYYDSGKNAASYNQSAGRFYVYDYLEATSAELTATKSDFLPLNSPYANTNGMQLGTYVPDGEHANMTNYVYDAKFSDSNNKVQTNYAFGMKMDIRFYLPNKPGEDGNQDLNGNDMRFMFSGDDDLWVLVDGKVALDIGGIHQAETGEINFSTGEVLVQGSRNNNLSSVIQALEPGEHTLTVMYLERGASHSNCAIYFNLAPRFNLSIQKEDVLTRDVLNGAQFSVYRDLECTIPAELWENQDSYLRGDPATNVFTVKNGSATMWGMGAGNTYYMKETRPPDDMDYGFPNGIIRMVLDKRGAATYSVMILDGGDGISGGFTVHGFRVDDETQQAYIIATNAPKWVQDVTSVEARKVWADGKDHSGESVTVYLTVRDPDGTVRRLQEAQLSVETDWTHLWENLPKYYEDGTTLIQYGVEEAYVSGYYSQVEKVDSYDVTTVKWTATTTLENNKTYLLKTGSGFLSTQNRNSDTGYMWVDEATAQQSDLAQWKVTKNGNNYKLTNLAGQTITFYYNNGSPTDFYASTGGESNAAKQYFAYAVSSNQIRLYYDAPNNRDYYLISSMTGSQKFKYDTTARNGLLFTPMTQSQSTTSKPVEGEQAYRITNTPLSSETSVTVRKEWDNHLGDDPTLYEQAQVTVKLLANGKDTGRTVTLTLKNGWTDAFRGLPYQDSEGNVIQYTVEEVWTSKDWIAEYGPIETVSGGKVPTYSTTVTNVYRWGHGVQLPSTGTAARLLYILSGSSIMLFSLVYGFVSRRKRERRTK